jgi:catalase-peroxidase
VFTSGFEGPWTTTPLKWSNQYFSNLLKFNWTLELSPAKHQQFIPTDRDAPQGIMMLVSDLSLIKHDFYKKYVEEFARNLSSLEYEFSHAWYHLASHDMGPYTRCAGPFVPPPQSWQHPLPPPPPSDQLPNMDDVKKQILAIMRPALPHPALAPDYDGKSLYYGAAFIKLAWQCSATYRRTDHHGGCNGARVRFAPQAQWDVNKGMDAVIKVLQAVKDMFPKLSWADLIVYASHVAIEDSSAAAAAQAPKPFCPGRTDASADDEPITSLQVCACSSALKPSEPTLSLQPIIGDSASDAQYRDAADLLGLTLREMVALHGRVRSASLARLQGYNGSWSPDAAVFGNQFYVTLLSETWEPLAGNTGGVLQYKAVGKDMYMNHTKHPLRPPLSPSPDTTSPPAILPQQLHGSCRPQHSVDARSPRCRARICG